MDHTDTRAASSTHLWSKRRRLKMRATVPPKHHSRKESLIKRMSQITCSWQKATAVKVFFSPIEKKKHLKKVYMLGLLRWRWPCENVPTCPRVLLQTDPCEGPAPPVRITTSLTVTGPAPSLTVTGPAPSQTTLWFQLSDNLLTRSVLVYSTSLTALGGSHTYAWASVSHTLDAQQPFSKQLFFKCLVSLKHLFAKIPLFKSS